MGNVVLEDNREIVFKLAKRELEVMIEQGQRPMLSWAMNPESGAFAVAKATFDDTNEVINALKSGAQDWGHRFIFKFLGIPYENGLNMPFVFGHIFWRGNATIDWSEGRSIHIDFDPTRGRIYLPDDFIKVGKLFLDFVSADSFVHIPKEDYDAKGETVALKGISKLGQLASINLPA